MCSEPVEYWDIYDENRIKTGRTHRRGVPLPEGDYHLVVNVWIQNNEGKYLCTKRDPVKPWPNLWECTGGSALAGDDSLTAALREVLEETGLHLRPEDGRLLYAFKRETDFMDVWFFKMDAALSDVTLQPGETCDAMWASQEDIRRMYDNGTFVPVIDYLDKLFEDTGL